MTTCPEHVRVEPMSDPVDSSTFQFESDDGTSIHVYAWVPEGDVRATVQIAHGLAEHAGRYADLAKALNAEGWAVYANDHRGHGRSVPPGKEPGDFGEDGFSRAVGDVLQLHHLVAARHPDRPRIFFGHSGGSFMLQRILWQRPEVIDAVIMSGSNGKPPPIATLGRGIARLERKRLGPTGRSKLLNAMSFDDFNKKFKPNRTDFDWLSRDEASVDAYIADPLCGFMVTTQTWVTLLDGLSDLLDDGNLARLRKDLPIFILSGTEDPVGDMGRGPLRLADSYRAAGLPNVELKLYVGGRHEMLHEINRDEVVDDIVSWIARTID
jgi:alpha-beta hydrolase superfamily lysophospholipase